MTSVVAASRSLTVFWNAGSNGGSVILGFTICVAPTGGGAGRKVCADAVGDASSAALVGLVNGVSYAVSVTARNAAGQGTPGTSTGVPVTVPGRMVSTVASARAGAVDLSWSPPEFDGGSALLGYSICIESDCTTLDPGATSVRLDGLTNGVRYVVSVQAVNQQGASELVRRSFMPLLVLGS